MDLAGQTLGNKVALAGDSRAPATLTGAAQFGVRIPLAYALVYLTGMGSSGIWLAINVSDIFQGLVMSWYFRRGSWKARYQAHRAVLEGAAPPL